MREIISIQLGQCGNQVGSQYWETISQEHGLDSTGYIVEGPEQRSQYLNVMFSESASERYVPRSVLIDLEPGVLDHVRSSRIGALFRPDNFIFGQTGAGNNFGKGRFTEGAEILEYIMDVVRREAEMCDCMQGFQLINSLGGGTGSGLGTLVLETIGHEFPDRIITTYSVIPSPKVSETVVENYNAVLALHHFIDTTHMTYCMDNEALYNICSNTLQMSHPTLPDLNHLINLAMSGFTSSFRFPGCLNADFRKITTNMVPYPRLHFFIPGFAPITSRGVQAYRRFSVQSLVYQLFEPGNLMVACNPSNGKYITAGAIFRGRMSSQQVEHHLYNMMTKKAGLFVDWLPSNIKTGMCDFPSPGMKQSVSFIGNSTAIVDVWSRMQESFMRMYKKRAYTHWFLGEGLEECEFDQSYEKLSDLISEYQQYESSKFFEPEEFDEEDEVEVPFEEETEINSVAPTPRSSVVPLKSQPSSKFPLKSLQSSKFDF